MPPRYGWWFCPSVPNEKWKAQNVLVELADGTQVEAHWACDLSGEEQPPFRGWFKAYKDGRGYIQIEQPLFWRRV